MYSTVAALMYATVSRSLRLCMPPSSRPCMLPSPRLFCHRCRPSLYHRYRAYVCHRRCRAYATVTALTNVAIAVLMPPSPRYIPSPPDLCHRRLFLRPPWPRFVPPPPPPPPPRLCYRRGAYHATTTTALITPSPRLLCRSRFFLDQGRRAYHATVAGRMPPPLRLLCDRRRVSVTFAALILPPPPPPLCHRRHAFFTFAACMPPSSPCLSVAALPR